MLSIRTVLSAALLTAAVAATAHAQMPPSGETTGATSRHTTTTTTTTTNEPSTVDEVKTWSRKKYNTARREWRKDKAKWAGCRSDAKAQKLHGRANWSFLYSCMKG